MGTGAYMNVVNATAEPVTLTVGKMQCMYDDGDEGSNIQTFANETLQPGETFPPGQGQYVEAKGSGSCAFDQSYFTINASNVGSFSISLSQGSAWGVGNPPTLFGFSITQGPQLTIKAIVL